MKLSDYVYRSDYPYLAALLAVFVACGLWPAYMQPLLALACMLAIVAPFALIAVILLLSLPLLVCCIVREVPVIALLLIVAALYWYC